MRWSREGSWVRLRMYASVIACGRETNALSVLIGSISPLMWGLQ
jgi:hypothetical protein